MDPLAFRPQGLGNIAGKGNHIVVGDGFNFVDPFNGEGGVLANLFDVFGRNVAQLAPGFVGGNFNV